MNELEDRDRRLREAIVNRYRSGETMEKIAKSYSLGWKKVREVLLDAGVRIKHRSEYPQQQSL